MKHKMPVFVVSGHTMALAVVRALGENGVPVAVLHYDARDTAQASRYARADVKIPHPLVDEPAFVEAIIRQARRYGRAVLMPASDESVVAISRNRGILAEYCEVACPEWSVTERFIDKSRTYALADANGIPAPRTLVPSCLADLDEQAQSIGFPLLLKPAESHLYFERFKRKMLRADNIATLRTAYCEAVDFGLAVTLQEIIPGDDSAVVNYNSYTWEGRPVAEFTARQLRKAPPVFGSPRVARSERIPEVIEPGRKILAAMGFNGFSCTEFKQDSRDGVYKLLEVNGRHNLSGLLAVRCGMNFPLIQYRHLAEGILADDHQFCAGVYWTDFFRDAGYSAAYVRTERHSPAAYVRPYARRQCDAIFDRRDMKPFWVRLQYLARNAFGAGRKSLLGK
jgi:predicted ATP-grasp superfamily ATP-dependent carboligase